MIKNDFFVIDSENLENVETCLYGYVLNENGFLTNDDLSDYRYNFHDNGVYVYVENKDSTITINQDYHGSYSLFCYRNGSRFAVSNSLLKLVEYLREKQAPMTYNDEFANLYSTETVISSSVSETYINEIELLKRNCAVIIDSKKKELSLKFLPIDVNTVKVGSKEYFQILDSWRDRWVSIFRKLIADGENVSIDASGGIDSRLVLTLLLSANIDYDSIRVYSLTDGLHTHSEDLQIVNEMASRYGFKVNDSSCLNLKELVFSDVSEIMGYSFYTKLGLHKQMYFKTFAYEKPLFRITGNGGEIVRPYWSSRPKAFIKQRKYWANNLGFDSNKVAKVIRRSYKDLQKMYGIMNGRSKMLSHYLFRESYSRNHFCKSAVESIFSNTITLSPLLDPELSTLKMSSMKCSDNFLLAAIIYTRFQPDILDFRFDGKRSINKKTIEYAKKLNSKFPLHKTAQETVSKKPMNEILKTPSFQYTKKDMENAVQKIYYDDSFKTKFINCFSEEIYKKLIQIMNQSSYFPISYVYSCIASLWFKMNAENNVGEFQNIEQWLSSMLGEGIRNVQENSEELEKEATGRVDIQNIGDEKNSIKIEKCDGDYSYPKWMKDKKIGEGVVVNFEAKKLSVNFTCVGDGQIAINLRGPSKEDENKKRIPVYVKYGSFSVNGKNLLDKAYTVWHDKPLVYKKMCKDGENISITIERG